MATKEEFLATKCTNCPSGPLSDLSQEFVQRFVDKYGLGQLMTRVFSAAIPNDEEEEVEDGDWQVRENLQCGIAKLNQLKPVPSIVARLGEAFWHLRREEELHPFDPPREGESFSVVLHDVALSTFRETLVEWHERLQLEAEERELATYIFLAYARSLFETRAFQAPPRTDPRKAVEDAMGLSDLWAEYLHAWGLL
jgi:hypothetical protein